MAPPRNPVDALIPADQGECLSVRCEQCRGRDSHIRLEFGIQDETKLLVNGYELYPDPMMEMMANVTESGSKKDGVREQAVGYGLTVALRDQDRRENVSLIDVDYKMRQVDGAVVKGIPVVHVRLIELGSGQLLIGSITQSDDVDVDCGAIQCWAYRLTGATFGVSSQGTLQRCCHLRGGASEPSRNATLASSKPALESSKTTMDPSKTTLDSSSTMTPAATASDAPDWYKTIHLQPAQSFQPMLLGFVAFAMLAFLAMRCGRAIAGGKARKPGDRDGLKPLL